jgi:NADPH:quinone reductase-like Zn-dependent oxidoreductase
MPHAILERTYGDPDVLHYEQTGTPSLRADEVLVAVHAAGVNPVDIAIRQGFMNTMFTLPIIPGGDIAGIVEATGEKVGEFKKGDAVYGMIGFTGGYAEYAVARAATLAPKPRSLDFVHAAGTPLTALAAWQSLFDLGKLKAGERILIHGAAGGVGTFAVQFAHNAGAHIIATAAPQDVEYVRSIGADEVIDYTGTRFENVISDIDFVFDVIGGETQERSWNVLKHGGTLVTTKNAPSEVKAREKKATIKRLLVHPDGEGLRKIGALIDEGRVTVTVSDTFSLARAAEAHHLLQTTHTRGKIVLMVR